MASGARIRASAGEGALHSGEAGDSREVYRPDDRQWESRGASQERSTRAAIVVALATKLRLDKDALLEEVEQYLAQEPANSSVPVEVRVPIPPGKGGDWLQQFVKEAIDGFSERGSTYCLPSFLKGDAEELPSSSSGTCSSRASRSFAPSTR